MFSPETIRDQFPALGQTIDGKPVYFLDGPGGTQVPRRVSDSMVEYFAAGNSNLGGAFFSSRDTGELVASARLAAAELVNAPSPDNIVFGANMTTLTFSLSRSISRDWQAGDEVVVTALDHYANVSTWQQAAADKGATVHQVRVSEDDCTLDMAHLESLIGPKTRLIAVTYASNTTGSIVDVKRVAALAKKFGAAVYVDAVHYAPHQLVDVQDIGCDFLVCSAYKFFGPHLGLAYIAPQWLGTLTPYKVEPATDTGPGRFETGTLSFEALAGFKETISYLASWGSPTDTLRQRLAESYQQYHSHEMTLSRYFLDKLAQYKNIRLYGIEEQTRLEQRTPTFAIRIEGASPSDVAIAAGKENICIWHGHFYAQGLVEQLGLMDKGGVIRVGFMHYNTVQEIDHLFDVLAPFLSPS